MRAGGGKQKGSKFEREICCRLSLWVTNGKRKDVFWRSAMSGGRATLKLGLVRQCGDICAVNQEGFSFADQWLVECKHVRELGLESLLIKGNGLLEKFWRKCRLQANQNHRDPMIICRQNGWPILVITRTSHAAHWAQPLIRARKLDVTLFEEILARPYSG